MHNFSNFPKSIIHSKKILNLKRWCDLIKSIKYHDELHNYIMEKKKIIF